MTPEQSEKIISMDDETIGDEERNVSFSAYVKYLTSCFACCALNIRKALGCSFMLS